ncbi:MAG: FkbM family methyltransferase [Acidobacteriota bacterium]
MRESRSFCHDRRAQTVIPSGQTQIGRMLRWPLKAMPKAAVIPIMSGPARGVRWVVGASIHGCWLGTYEKTKQKRFAAAVSRNDVVYDLGAQAGFYSLLASRLVGPQGAVYAFEPLPRNVGFLQEHIKLNGVTNINVFKLAIGGTDGTAQFEDGPNPLQGSLSERGAREVRIARLDTLFSEGQLRAPSVLKNRHRGWWIASVYWSDEIARDPQAVGFPGDRCPVGLRVL